MVGVSLSRSASKAIPQRRSHLRTIVSPRHDRSARNVKAGRCRPRATLPSAGRLDPGVVGVRPAGASSGGERWFESTPGCAMPNARASLQVVHPDDMEPLNERFAAAPKTKNLIAASTGCVMRQRRDYRWFLARAVPPSARQTASMSGVWSGHRHRRPSALEAAYARSATASTGWLLLLPASCIPIVGAPMAKPALCMPVRRRRRCWG